MANKLRPSQILQVTEHRPWAMPNSPWVWRQSWYDAAFIHVPIALELLRPLVPEPLELDTFDGVAWLTIVPFRMVDVGWRHAPSVWPMRDFPELNLRTYVKTDTKQGVWFLSLDTNCLPLVIAARVLVGLPYYLAEQKHDFSQQQFSFSSNRKLHHSYFQVSIRDAGTRVVADRGSFAHWATERYCLYAVRCSELIEMEVHHVPWSLRHGVLESLDTNLIDTYISGYQLATPICHLADGVDVLTFAAAPIGRVK